VLKWTGVCTGFYDKRQLVAQYIQEGFDSMQKFAPLVRDTRTKIYRTTSILFLVQLFGALGAGFFFVVQNILRTEHLLGALEPANENILWFILFWGTDFFMVAMTAVLCYLIAGLPGLAPGLALSVYFAHFAGTAPIHAQEAYLTFFATPLNQGGGVNIGYLGYFFMALFCSLLIKLLYAGWNRLKAAAGGKKVSLLQKFKIELTGEQLLEQVDLIVLVLIIPVACAALTFVVVRYGIQKPFAAFGSWAQSALLASRSPLLVGLLFGLMVGFDITGPVSMAAFGAASAAFFAGDARLLTIYGVCFITVGWSPFFFVLLSKFRKKPATDADDLNLAVSGPINAFFENVKLTVAFSMPFALRSPLSIIPGLMAGSGFAGALTALSGIVNTSYALEPPKYGMGNSMEALLRRGELYLSFALPLRSGDWLRCRIPLFFIILAGGLVGGLVIYALRCLQIKGQKKRGTYVESKGDIVLEMRELAKKHALALKK
jgi:fructose-specific phosphotransferase system IIC component